MSNLSQFIGGRIKSVQRGTIAIVSGASNTATVSAVDTNKSVLTHLGGYLRDSTTHLGNSRLTLTNSTTITATAPSTTDTTANIAGYQLVEYY